MSNTIKSMGYPLVGMSRTIVYLKSIRSIVTSLVKNHTELLMNVGGKLLISILNWMVLLAILCYRYSSWLASCLVITTEVMDYISVLRQLLRNAVISGASCIAIRVCLRNGLLEVADNGNGMQYQKLIKLGENRLVELSLWFPHSCAFRGQFKYCLHPKSTSSLSFLMGFWTNATNAEFLMWLKY